MDSVSLRTGLRGYHAYNRIWTNIHEDQPIFLMKQVNNSYDANAVAGFVMIEKSLVEVGHLPISLARTLSTLPPFSFKLFSCAVDGIEPIGAKGQKGLEIPIRVTIHGHGLPRETLRILKSPNAKDWKVILED